SSPGPATRRSDTSAAPRAGRSTPPASRRRTPTRAPHTPTRSPPDPGAPAPCPLPPLRAFLRSARSWPHHTRARAGRVQCAPHTHCSGGPQPMPRRKLDLRDLAAVLNEVKRLHQHNYDKTGEWNLAQICDHLTKVINGSIDGFDFHVS